MLIVPGILAGVVGAVLLVGMMLPQNHVATRTASVAAQPEKVWAAITGVGGYPAWRSGIDSVEYRLVPDGAGTRVTITENGEVYNPLFRFVSRFLMGHTSTITDAPHVSGVRVRRG